MHIYQVTVTFTIAAGDESDARYLVGEELGRVQNGEWRSWDIEQVEDTGEDA